MKIGYIYVACFCIIMTLSQSQVIADVVFSDSFESGDTLKTNHEGFQWTSGAWTSVVNSTTEVWKNGNVVDFSKENASTFPGKDWTAHNGEYSLRFRYAAGEAMSEQRFDLGTPMPDVWISFWLMVPVNFSFGLTGNPNKFFALWSDGYSSGGDGSTIWLGMHRYQETGADLAVTYSVGGNTASSAYLQNTPFISEDDAGKWMQIVLHARSESAPNADDGIIQTYRRWNGEENFQKIHEVINAPLKLPVSGPNGFKTGYLLGWANAAYEQDTEWLLDEFEVLDTAPDDLLIGKTPKPPVLEVN